MAFNINTRADNTISYCYERAHPPCCIGRALLEFMSVKHSQGTSTDGDCAYANGNPLSFANPHSCSAQNRSLGLKVKQEKGLRVRSWQSVRLFLQELPESHAEGAFFGSSSLGPSLRFALSEKPVYKTLVTHSIHALQVNNWLVLYPSCFGVFCNCCLL